MEVGLLLQMQSHTWMRDNLWLEGLSSSTIYSFLHGLHSLSSTDVKRVERFASPG